MFFVVNLTKEIFVHPKYFGADLIKVVRLRLMQDVEGSCDGKYGFIVAVKNVTKLGYGELESGKGHVSYHIEYEAIVFRPIKGQVLDVCVTEVNHVGIFAEAGPLSIFISNHCIPSHMNFEREAETPRYLTKTDQKFIQKDDKIRVRLIGVRIDNKELFAVGSIIEDYLGKLTDIS